MNRNYSTCNNVLACLGRCFVVLASLALGLGSAWATTVTISSSGTWTCPAGVTSISVLSLIHI